MQIRSDRSHGSDSSSSSGESVSTIRCRWGRPRPEIRAAMGAAISPAGPASGQDIPGRILRIFCQRVSRSCWMDAIRWWIQATASCRSGRDPGRRSQPASRRPGGDGPDAGHRRGRCGGGGADRPPLPRRMRPGEGAETRWMAAGPGGGVARPMRPGPRPAADAPRRRPRLRGGGLAAPRGDEARRGGRRVGRGRPPATAWPARPSAPGAPGRARGAGRAPRGSPPSARGASCRTSGPACPWPAGTGRTSAAASC